MTKYSAKRTECGHGHTHDSRLEAGRCNDLHILERAGEISRLEQQPTFAVVVNGIAVCKYVADFSYFSSTCRIVEDVKGMLTPVYRLKKKLVEASYPGTVITEFPPRKRKTRKREKRKAA